MFALKICQNVARGCFLRSLHRYGGVVLNKEIGKYQPPDELLQNIKSATDTLDLFDALSDHEKNFTSEQVMQSLKSLFVLQKSGNSSLQPSQIMSHPQFEKLCKNLRTCSRSFEINDIVEALKIMSYIGIPTKSNICHILLNLLRHQINDATLGHIIFLDFLLKKFDKTPLVEALQIALPMLFQMQLGTQIDHENVPQLLELLGYVTHNKISEQCITSIITSLTLHGENLKVEEATSIVWSLSDLRGYKSGYEKLLNNSFNVINKNYDKLSYKALEMTVTKSINKFINNFDEFYNEDLFNNYVKFVVKKDLGFMHAFYVLKRFNKISFINIDLLNYLSQKIIENPEEINKARPSLFFNIITGFSTANYTPPQWDSIKTIILQNPIINCNKNELPWMKFNLELMSLGCYDKNLLEKVFHDDFLEQYLAREQNTLDYLQMLSLYQSVMILHPEYDGILPNSRFIDKAIELNFEKQMYPLKSCLEYIYGGSEYVMTKVTTKYGHSIEHAIVFDKELQPIAIENKNESGLQCIDSMEYGINNKIVAICSFPRSHYAINQRRLKGIFDLRTRCIEALGIPVVAINVPQWTEMPEAERLAYIEREIKYILGR